MDEKTQKGLPADPQSENAYLSIRGYVVDARRSMRQLILRW